MSTKLYVHMRFSGKGSRAINRVGGSKNLKILISETSPVGKLHSSETTKHSPHFPFRLPASRNLPIRVKGRSGLVSCPYEPGSGVYLLTGSGLRLLTPRFPPQANTARPVTTGAAMLAEQQLYRWRLLQTQTGGGGAERVRARPGPDSRHSLRPGPLGGCRGFRSSVTGTAPWPEAPPLGPDLHPASSGCKTLDTQG